MATLLLAAVGGSGRQPGITPAGDTERERETEEGRGRSVLHEKRKKQKSKFC